MTHETPKIGTTTATPGLSGDLAGGAGVSTRGLAPGPAPALTGGSGPSRLAEATVPWDVQAMGKNRRLRLGRRQDTGQVTLYRPARVVRWWEGLSLALRASATERAPWPVRKTWVSIVACKPNHRGDVVNLVDGVCDAVRDGLKVDDRWVSLAGVDWVVNRLAPGSVMVTVWQTGLRSQYLCGRCGAPVDSGTKCQTKHPPAAPRKRTRP